MFLNAKEEERFQQNHLNHCEKNRNFFVFLINFFRISNLLNDASDLLNICKNGKLKSFTLFFYFNHVYQRFRQLVYRINMRLGEIFRYCFFKRGSKKSLIHSASFCRKHHSSTGSILLHFIATLFCLKKYFTLQLKITNLPLKIENLQIGCIIYKCKFVDY